MKYLNTKTLQIIDTNCNISGENFKKLTKELKKSLDEAKKEEKEE